MAKIDKKTVENIAKLANIPVSEKEEEELAKGFNRTLEAVDKLFTVDVSEVEPTHQVTGLENILREDKIDEKKMLNQKEALSNTKNKNSGYFVVNRIIDDKTV
ncbi:MAG: Asp-tRNA(Asn)/Glu-tRNA(Gln) amidotransferase subunit GatC [Candidatus Roizmanbacteria bacterium]